MRSVLLVLTLAACGAPTFVPVIITMRDSTGLYDVVAIATKKANPSCAANCELLEAIEDGGCRLIEVRSDGGYVCEPGGGQFLAFRGAPSDGGELVAPLRNLAPGSELGFAHLYRSFGYAECTEKLAVPPAGFKVHLERTTSSCIVSSSP